MIDLFSCILMVLAGVILGFMLGFLNKEWRWPWLCPKCHESLPYCKDWW